MSITIAPRHLRPLLELHDSPTADAIMSRTLPDVGAHLSSARLGALATLLGTAGRDDLVSTDGLVLQLLAELHSPPAALEVGHERGSPAATIDRARQYLEAHYHERCSLHDLASAVHISPFHLHRRFRATTGKTPQQYLSSVRLRHARGALAQSERSIGAIAASVGFGSASSFSTWFKRETGLSPTTYRVHASSPTEPAARPHRDPKRSG